MSGPGPIMNSKTTRRSIKLTAVVVGLFLLILTLCSIELAPTNPARFAKEDSSFSWCVFCSHQINPVADSGNISRALRHSQLKLTNELAPASVETLKRFPSCIIFGVSKGGTKALLEYLTLHPDVVAPTFEINFFCNKSLLERGIPWYVDQMPLSRADQITTEKSPDYFQHHFCADLIFAANNRTKLLLLLRDPVERLVSEYMQLMEKNPLIPAFERWAIHPVTNSVHAKLTSVMTGAYSEHLVHWLNVFPRNQLHVIESDSLRKNPLAEMVQVEKFLQLNPFFAPEDFYFNSSRGFYCTRRRFTGKTKCLGKSKGREHISVQKDALDKLRTFYKPYNEKLNDLLGYRFPWS